MKQRIAHIQGNPSVTRNLSSNLLTYHHHWGPIITASLIAPNKRIRNIAVFVTYYTVRLRQRPRQPFSHPDWMVKEK